MECFEIIFSLLFWGYFLYVEYFLYCMIPICVQIIFIFLINKEKFLKSTFMVFCTQGIVVSITQMLYEINNSLCKINKGLSLSNITASTNFKFDVIYTSVFTAILIFIWFIYCRCTYTKLYIRKFITISVSYLINIILMIFLIGKFGIIL